MGQWLNTQKIEKQCARIHHSIRNEYDKELQLWLDNEWMLPESELGIDGRGSREQTEDSASA